jgi:hypothetical protein
MGPANSKFSHVRFARPAQPIDATQALNLSAGVSNCKVSCGRSGRSPQAVPHLDVKSSQRPVGRWQGAISKDPARTLFYRCAG